MKKEILGLRISALRKFYSYSQEELASKIGVTRQALIKWEQGESWPSVEFIKKIADIFKITMDDLMNEEVLIESLFKEKNTEEGKPFVKINKSGIHVKGEEGEEVHIGLDGMQVVDNDEADQVIFKRNNDKVDKIADLVTIISMILCLVTYLTLGFVLTESGFGWSVFWPIFFFALVPGSLVKAIGKKDAGKFNIIFTVLGTYLFVGMLGNHLETFNGWGIPAVMFVAIPLYYSLVGAIKNLLRVSKDEKYIKENIIDNE